MKRAYLPLLWCLWLAALLCFLIGIISPIMSIRQLYLFEDEFSVLSALGLLAQDGQYLLSFIIGAFSVCMPVFKFIILAKVLSVSQQAKPQQQSKILEWMHRCGRWSMLDVFVIAVLIVGVKLSAFASVTLHIGLWAFSGALILLLVLTSLVQRLQR